MTQLGFRASSLVSEFSNKEREVAWFWWLIGVLVLFIWIASIVDIVRRPRSRAFGR